MPTEIIRCSWAEHSPQLQAYHDDEWGVPLHDDDKIFEMLILEGLQAGLSWEIILKKRLNYQQALDNFTPEKVACYNDKKINALLSNPNLIRHKLKMHAIIKNAQEFLKIQNKFGSFDSYIWQFVDYQPICHHRPHEDDIPSQTPLSIALSKDLKKHGFKFIGPVICYSFMQAIGMINDHVVDCFCFGKIQAKNQ